MELISKEYLLKAFGAFNDTEHAPEGWMSAMRTAREIVEDAPSVDAVDVVRCKDCIHKPYVVDVFNASYGDIPVLESNGKCPCINADDYFYSHMPDDDWFCANGERREADEH